MRRLEVVGGRSMNYSFDQSQICFVIDRSKSAVNLRELVLGNQDIMDFEKFLARVLLSNMKRKPENRLTHLGFESVNIRLELENDLVFLKTKLPGFFWINGKGLKSFTFTRKDRVNTRSEKTREYIKEAALKLLNDSMNNLESVII